MLHLYARDLRRPSGYWMVVASNNVRYAPTTTVRARNNTPYSVSISVNSATGASFTPR